MIAKMISVEALADLLQNAGAAAGSSGNGAALPGLDSDWPGQVWRIFIHSEQGSQSFAVTAPLSAPPSRQFKLTFRLTSWTWMLSAIELPDELRLRLAQELIKQTNGK